MSQAMDLTGHYVPDVGFIEVSGPDARSYLHNLSTNDVHSLTPESACETFFTTHKARTIAHAFVHCASADSFLIVVEDGVQKGRADALFSHLDRHLISERVELTRRNELAAFRIVGPKDPTCILTDGPLKERFSRTRGALLFHKHPPMGPLDYEVIGPAAEVDAFRDQQQSRGEERLTPESVELLRIESGWPAWGKEMDENRFVVELGRTAAISYSKGCYLGQEPIVMARDRGQVNRMLMGFSCSSPVEAGETIKQGEIELFRATSVARTQNGTIGLGFVRGQATAGTTMMLGARELRLGKTNS